MHLTFTDEDERFRSQARAWLARTRSLNYSSVAAVGRPRVDLAWQRAQYDGPVDLVRGVREGWRPRCGLLLRRQQPRRPHPHREGQRATETPAPVTDPARRGRTRHLVRKTLSTRPRGQVQSGIQARGAVANVVVARTRRGTSIGKIGAVRLSAWIWVFSSTQSTRARSGGSR